ncbi:MAG: hypothetical protein Q3971_02420 [Moraxella sp.]|nr:hypothetical protein [Moraxella sp.]
MKPLKSLALTAILSSILALTGCTHALITGTAQDIKNPPTKTVKEQDSLAGFVIHQDGRLVMLGQRYVYVFDDNDKTDRLKKLLTTPQFLKLKYHWEITNGGAFDEKARHKISYSRNNTFNFSAFFWYQYSTAEELAIFQKVGFAQSYSMEGANREQFTIIPDFTGKVYQHNASTKTLLKTAKPLSKPYQFGIDRQVPNRAKSFGQALLLPLALPFTLVGDILILPISLPITLEGGIDWR